MHSTITRDLLAFANGNIITSTDEITNNPNGSKTTDIVTNLGNGKTTTTDETVSGKNGAITGTIIQANGSVDQVTGAKDKTSYGSDTVLTLTNAKGQTESLNQGGIKE